MLLAGRTRRLLTLTGPGRLRTSRLGKRNGDFRSVCWGVAYTDERYLGTLSVVGM